MLPENISLSSDIGKDLNNFLARKSYSSLAVLVDELDAVLHHVGRRHVLLLREGRHVEGFEADRTRFLPRLDRAGRQALRPAPPQGEALVWLQ